MARVIFESRTLQEFGGFEYRIVSKASGDFYYEVHGSKDAMGVESWIAAGETALRSIKEDLVREYLGELVARSVPGVARARQ